ncbi:uncharacterized protein LOC18428286 [Amborella trichopoda]|uniref:uncharacterized protein LOC18428286 n=1 Tax=Amborella trichopoda TaxID=13333 RepID=UPI0009BE0B0F|nr:uncharacterized protein LOC18428286 [Amborella trichopoda]|eukprot:XP_020519260.1 uncharacterized protein LOC18428286 [Amborella trichopoda]
MEMPYFLSSSLLLHLCSRSSHLKPSEAISYQSSLFKLLTLFQHQWLCKSLRSPYFGHLLKSLSPLSLSLSRERHFPSPHISAHWEQAEGRPLPFSSPKKSRSRSSLQDSPSPKEVQGLTRLDLAHRVFVERFFHLTHLFMLHAHFARVNLMQSDLRRDLNLEPFVQLDKDTREEDKGVQRTVVNEPCPKCLNPQLEYHTKQLRSADEGQTVFYDCPKCRHKFSVNT